MRSGASFSSHAQTIHDRAVASIRATIEVGRAESSTLLTPAHLTSMIMRLATPIILLIALSTSAATAQPRIRVSEPSCESCGIAVAKLFTIGGLDDRSNMSRPNTAAMNSRGELLVSYPDSRGQFFVYGPDGTFRRAVGRRGAGPGEFNLIRHIRVGRGDTIHIADLALRRTVLSPDFRFVRSTRFPLNTDDFELIAGDTVLIAAIVNTRAATGFPLHKFADAQEMFSFGVDKPVAYPPDQSEVLRRVITVDDQGSLWAASVSSYTIQQFDRSGKLLRTLYREPDWFKPHAAPFRVLQDQPPSPRITDVRIDGDGLVWVLLRVADPDWKEAVVPGPANGRQRLLGLKSEAGYYDTLIEVIDPQSAKTIASMRVPDYMKLFIGGRESYSYREDGDGLPYIDVWRLSRVVEQR